jgi:mRNA interferase MazF
LAHILRGEIYWADLNPVRAKEQGALRPVLILSNDHFNARSGTVIALAITGRPQRAGFPLTFPLPEETLAHSAWIKLSQIRTISVERLGKRVAAIEPEEMDRIIDGFVELIT